MENRNAQANTEDGIKAPGAQPNSGLRSSSKRAGVGPTIAGVSQVVFADTSEMGREKQHSSVPGGPEKEPGHTTASEEWTSEPRTQKLRPQTGPGKKQSFGVPKEGPRKLLVDQDQTKRGSKLGLQPPRVPVVSNGLQQLDSGKAPKSQQDRQPNPGAKEGQSPESGQGLEEQSTPGHQVADMAQSVEPGCTLDSCGQPLGGNPLQEVGTSHIKPQDPLPRLGPKRQEDSSQEEKPLSLMATLKEKLDNPFQPSKLRPKTTKRGDEAMETQPAPEPVPPPEMMDIEEKRELDYVWRQPQESTLAIGPQNFGNPWRSFIKCLLEVEEEEEASQKKATKARTTPARKLTRTLIPLPTLGPFGNSAPGLPPTLVPTQTSVPPVALSWARPPAPGLVSAPTGASVLTSGPRPGLLAPCLHLARGREKFFRQSCHRSLSYTKAGQDQGYSPLRLRQQQEKKSEERLTLKQEEAFRSYFEIFNGPGEVDAQSLESILLLIGVSLTPAQVYDALMSADIDGDGHVDFKDFLAVMTDTKRFFCSVEQNALMGVTPPNPHTLFFEILSLMVEMLALPEAALEEITSYYQKKLKEANCRVREADSVTGRLRSRKKLPYNLQQADNLKAPERNILRLLSQLKQQNYAANLQSPYAQVPCIPLCPRLDRRAVCRKPGNHCVLAQCTTTNSGPHTCSLFCPKGTQGGREHSSGNQKWLSFVPARTH